MGDFLRLVLDLIKEAWPFRVVEQAQQGVWHVCGRYWRTVGPGTWPVVPWFMNIHPIDVVPQQLACNWRQDVTTQAGELVSFELVAEYRVFDANLAHNAIYDYEQATSAIIRAVLADRIASVKPHRLQPEERRGLLRDLRGWADEETNAFGVEVTKIRFASFVTNVRTFRLLGGDPR